MPAIDYANPITVFCRLAQLTADSQHRLAEMDRLDEEQSEADRELSQVKAIAKAYLTREDEKCFEASATPPGSYTCTNYVVSLDDEGSVICRRREYLSYLEPLTHDEIADALMCTEEAPSLPTIQELLTERVKEICRCDGNGEHSYKLPLSAFDPPSQPTVDELLTERCQELNERVREASRDLGNCD